MSETEKKEWLDSVIRKTKITSKCIKLSIEADIQDTRKVCMKLFDIEERRRLLCGK